MVSTGYRKTWLKYTIPLKRDGEAEGLNEDIKLQSHDDGDACGNLGNNASDDFGGKAADEAENGAEEGADEATNLSEEGTDIDLEGDGNDCNN